MGEDLEGELVSVGGQEGGDLGRVAGHEGVGRRQAEGGSHRGRVQLVPRATAGVEGVHPGGCAGQVEQVRQKGGPLLQGEEFVGQVHAGDLHPGQGHARPDTLHGGQVDRAVGRLQDPPQAPFLKPQGGGVPGDVFAVPDRAGNSTRLEMATEQALMATRVPEKQYNHRNLVGKQARAAGSGELASRSWA